MSDELSQDELAELFPAAYTANKRPLMAHAGAIIGVPNYVGRPCKERGISTRARMVLSLELRGKSQLEIAQILQLRPNSVNRLVHTDRYIQAREVLLGRMDAEFSAMKPAAFNALRMALTSHDDNTALRASEAWMRAAGFGQYGKGNAQQGITAEDVARQLLQVNVNVNIDAKS